MESIADQPLRELARAIASREPAPGAGVAAAAALALGIACARKSAAITLKRDPDRGDLGTNDARLAELQGKALHLANTDANCFPAALRHEGDASRKLVEADVALLDCAGEALEIVARLSVQVDEPMKGDILGARALITAAATIVRGNLLENAQSSDINRSDADR